MFTLYENLLLQQSQKNNLMKEYKGTISCEWYIYIWREADILVCSGVKYLKKHKWNMRQRNRFKSRIIFWKMKRHPNAKNKSEILKVKLKKEFLEKKISKLLSKI